MQIDLSNKVAVVTGASGELGRVISRTLASCGADVAVHYHSSETKAHAVKDDIEAMGRRSGMYQADITQEADVHKLRDAITSDLGAPDIVVLNAVAQYNWTSVLEQPLEDYESQYKSCILQAVLLAKAFVPAMIEKNEGRFIAVNTECAMACAPGQSAYVSGKRGMDGVIRVLAREVGQHNITVNQVAPGWMVSDRGRDEYDASTCEYSKKLPLRHRGEDKDIAYAVTFFASEYARFITGTYLPVCGGNVIPGI
jgi:3-oxoacyl-[acyl-carrier protein] reductase